MIVRLPRRAAWFAACWLATASCNRRTPAPESSPARPVSPGAPSNALVAARPYKVRVSEAAKTGRALPVVFALHGYGGESFRTDDVAFHVGRALVDGGFLFAGPEGTVDPRGRPFWNATDACCNFYSSTVDDVAYISAVLDDLAGHFAIDSKRVYFIGHSNGGFMANRLACDLSARIAAVVNIGGGAWADMARCKPAQPVAVLMIRSDADTVISYDGGNAYPTIVSDPASPPADYPSAVDGAAFWAKANGCQPYGEDLPERIDVDAGVPGAETSIRRWRGCRAGGASELWTVHGGHHDTSVAAEGAGRIVRFLSEHVRP